MVIAGSGRPRVLGPTERQAPITRACPCRFGRSPLTTTGHPHFPRLIFCRHTSCSADISRGFEAKPREIFEKDRFLSGFSLSRFQGMDFQGNLYPASVSRRSHEFILARTVAFDPRLSDVPSDNLPSEISFIPERSRSSPTSYFLPVIFIVLFIVA